MAEEFSNARTSAGTVMALASGMPTESTADAYAALDFVDIAEITNIGEFGREYNLVTHNPLASRKTFKRKGSYNDGSFTVDMAHVMESEDAGQARLSEALNSDETRAARIILQSGETFYMPVQVLSKTVNPSGVDDITSSSVSIEIDGDIVVSEPVAPDAGA